MSDELHKYPGNLKHHKVDAQARREPMLSDVECERMADVCNNPFVVAEQVRDIYEDRLGKYADLIQRFVDHNDKWVGNGCLEADMEWDAIVCDCIAIGFKPSEQ